MTDDGQELLVLVVFGLLLTGKFTQSDRYGWSCGDDVNMGLMLCICYCHGVCCFCFRLQSARSPIGDQFVPHDAAQSSSVLGIPPHNTISDRKYGTCLTFKIPIGDIHFSRSDHFSNAAHHRTIWQNDPGNHHTIGTFQLLKGKNWA